MSKNIPPLTDFEEEYLASRLMQRFSTTCLMLDAQLFLHNEAIAVVKQNYRLKVKTKLFNLLIPIINGIFL
jgi:hypothetical protein